MVYGLEPPFVGVLASAPAAFERIKDPPLNERTGRRQWSGDAAKWVVGWATATPVTVQAKVESIRGLTVDETVAVQGLANCCNTRKWPCGTGKPRQPF